MERSSPSPSPENTAPANLETEFRFITRQLVMFSHLNAHGRLFGGQLVGWLDAGVAQEAMRVMRTSNIVTKRFGEIIFNHPGEVGDSVEIWCRVESEGRTSITLDCRALVRRFVEDCERRHQICQCSIVYVALDEEGRPTPWGENRS